MSVRKSRLTRPLIAVAGAAALLVTMAAPASAALPLGQDIEATVVGGEITVGDTSFPLGGGTGLTDCNPTEIPSTVSASIDGAGAISNFDFEFQPGTQDVPLLGITCITLVVTNEASLAGQLTVETSGDGTVTIDGPSPQVRVDIDNALLPAACAITGVTTGALTGPISQAGPPNDSTLATGTFNVPAVTSANCGSLGAAAVNAFLGLPDTGTATIELSVAW